MSKSPKDFKVFVSIDIKTTGLDFKHDEIISIGAIKFDLRGKVFHRYHQLFRPWRNFIPPEVSKETGITCEDLKENMAYQDIGAPKKIRQFCNGLPLVGSNISDFDVKFLRFEHVETPAIFATTDIAHKQFNRRLSLEECCNKFEIPHNKDVSRSTLENATLAMEVFLRLVFDSKQETLQATGVVDTLKPDPIISKPVVYDRPVFRDMNYPKDKPSIFYGNLIIPFTCDERYHWWKPSFKMTMDQVVAEAIVLP